MATMTITAMRVVREVARVGSFSAAGDELGYTQSAISRQVAVAERSVRQELFVRHARGVRLTAAGEIVVRRAGRILDEMDAIEHELAAVRDRLAGRVVVGGFPTANSILFPRALARVLRAHPGLEVELRTASTSKHLEWLRRGRLEVAILATGHGLPELDLDGLQLTRLPVGPDLGVAVGTDHQFARRDSIDAVELHEESWIVGAKDDVSSEFGSWPDIDRPRVAFVAKDWPTRLGLVGAGLGIALVPAFAARAVPLDVRWVPVSNGGQGLKRQVWGATEKVPSPAASAVMRALLAEVPLLGAPRSR